MGSGQAARFFGVAERMVGWCSGEGGVVTALVVWDENAEKGLCFEYGSGKLESNEASRYLRVRRNCGDMMADLSQFVQSL